MNNNRGNNRRRGRGNNRQSGGGQQLNRIDSRARGNAPQLLEKYRKLAHDAHLNGERVSEEYYLQFADHYFRVIADTRVRQDDPRRRDDRWQDQGDADRDEDQSEYGDDQAKYGMDAYDDRPRGGERAERTDRGERIERSGRSDRPARSDEVTDDTEDKRDEAPAEAADSRSVYEPAENPFVRGSRAGLKQRRPRRERQGEGAGETAEANDQTANDEREGSLDLAALPPAIAARKSPAGPADGDTEGEAQADAKPRRRTRRTRPPADDADEALQAVS